MDRLDRKVEAEVKALVKDGTRLLKHVQSLDDVVSAEVLTEISTWVTRLGQMIRRLYGDNSQAMESYTSALKTNNFYYLHGNHYSHLAQLVGVANAVAHDLRCGLLANWRGLIQAEVFADFLEMGEYLLDEGYKDAAAVIIGTVLEDSLRKLAEANDIPTAQGSGKPLTIEPLNAALAKKEVYSKLVQKQITSWAHIRNKAAHGEFGEYNSEQVKMMLLFVQGFAADYLS